MRAAAAAEWMYGTPEPRRHMLLATLAFVASLLIHLLVLTRLPPLGMLQPPVSWDEPPAVQTPFRVRDVRPDPPPTVIDPAPPSLTAERSAEVFRPAAPRVEERALDPLLAALPEPERTLAGEREALAAHAPVPEPAARDPRLQQLEITRRLVPDREAARPRRITPGIARTPEAPDITYPALTADPAGRRLDLDAPVEAAADPTGDPGAATARAGPGGGALPGPASRRGGLATSVSDRILEELEPPRTVESVDRYLDFSVRTHRPVDEPDRVYFRVEIRRAGPESLPVLPRDVLLIQDCSESMTQALLDQCKVGLRSFIQTLSGDDRFDLMGFRESQMHCFGEWAPVTATTRSRAQWFIEQLEAMGRTDVMASLEHILSLPTTPGRPTIAILVTDGIPTSGVLDQSAILEQFSRANAGAVSVFPFGGGARVNRFLLDFLGFKNRGDAFFVGALPAIPGGLQRLAQEIRRPVLADLSYQVSGMPAGDIYPRTLTHLYLDRPLILFGRVPADSDAVGLRIAGRAGPRLHDIVHRLDWAAAESAGIEIRDAWAMQKAYHLIGEHAVTADPLYLERLRALTRRTGIRTPYADALDMPDRRR